MKGFGSRGFGTKKRMRKFEEGGATDYAESGSAGGTNISFGEAFRAARKQGLKTFTWRGKEYSTDTKEDKAKKAEKSLTEVEVTSKRPDFSKIYEMDKVTDKAGAGSRGVPRRGGARDPEASKKVEAKIDEKIGASIRGSTSSMKNTDSVYERLARGSNESERKAKRVREAREAMSYRKGGSVGSASKRADGIAQRGKTRGKMC
jgi:hypothetical protein